MLKLKLLGKTTVVAHSTNLCTKRMELFSAQICFQNMANIQYCHILQPGVLQHNYTLEAELFDNKWSFYHSHKENPKDYNLLNSSLDIPYRFHQKHEGDMLIPLHAYSSKLCCW